MEGRGQRLIAATLAASYDMAAPAALDNGLEVEVEGRARPNSPKTPDLRLPAYAQPRRQDRRMLLAGRSGRLRQPRFGQDRLEQFDRVA